MFVYPAEEWHNIEEKFRNISMTSKDARKFFPFFLCWGSRSGAGQAGQNSASAGFCANMPIYKKDVVLVGVLSRVEIWDKDRWQENTYDEDEMDEIAEHMADLGFSI